MRAGGCGAAKVCARSLKVASAGFGLAGLAASAAFAAAPGGPAEAWRTVSGLFVGPDGVNLVPTAIAGGAVALVAAVGVIRGLNKKPARAAAASAPVAAAPASAAARRGPAAPISISTEPAAAPVAPAKNAKPASAAAPGPSPIVSVKPLPRKLPLELDRKPRDASSRPGAPGRSIKRAVKLAVARRAIIAHAQKSKLSLESESTKRRPTTVPPGRRSASSHTPSSTGGRRSALRTQAT
jgi:hypothetical protein